MNAILKIVPSLASCFFGYKLQKIWIALVWFFFGFSLTKSVLLPIVGIEIVVIIAAICLGIVVSLFSFRLQMISIFLIYFILGIALVIMFTEAVWYNIAIGALLGIAFGWLGVKFYKPMFIITSAFSGAYMVASEIIFYLPEYKDTYLLIFTVILGLIGSFIQFKSNKKSDVTIKD